MSNKKGIILSLLACIFLMVIYLGVINPFNEKDGTNSRETVVKNDDMEEVHDLTTEDMDLNRDGNPYSNDEIGDVTEENAETNHNENISVFIADFHQILNDITTYKRHRNINWDNMNTTKKDLSNRISKLLEKKELLPPSMQIDLERMLLLADIGTENQDSTAIIYLHRILHDLDVEYNNYRPNNKFGFSNYDSGGENQMVISNYIKENGISEDTN